MTLWLFQLSVALTSATVRPPAVQALVLSDQAVRLLALDARSFQTEFLGCMIGEVRDGVVRVDRIAPADVSPLRSTTTAVVPEDTCEEAGWTGTVGMIHSHPTVERGWYYFPGTQVPTSDAQSFIRTPYAVDAIMCGAKVVWIGPVVRRLLFSLLCSALLAGPISAQAPVSSQDTLAYTTSSVRLREKPFPNGARAGGAASRHRRPALRLLPRLVQCRGFAARRLLARRISRRPSIASSDVRGARLHQFPGRAGPIAHGDCGWQAARGGYPRAPTTIPDHISGTVSLPTSALQMFARAQAPSAWGTAPTRC